MRSRSLTRDSLCINPHHLPSLLSNKSKHAGVSFLIGQQGAGLGTKLAALSSHHPHRHHLYLRRTMRDGSQLCRPLGYCLGFILAGDTPRFQMRLEGQDGTRPEDQDGMRARLIPLTPRGYHRPSIHDNPLRTIGSWTASTPASEGQNSTQVKLKIHLTLTCRVRPSGTNSSSNSSWTSTRC